MNSVLLRSIDEVILWDETGGATVGSSGVYKLRLFWALSLPGDLKAKLGGFQAELEKLSPDAKWVKQENLHLTVKFLGEVEKSDLPALTRAVTEGVRGQMPFRLKLAGWGTFGRPPRVFWVGVNGDVGALRELRVRVEKALLPLGFPVEKKFFSPHLTLGRLRSPRNVNAMCERAEELVAGRGSWGEFFVVNRIDLMQSTLTRQGPVYREVLTLDLV
jgi:2'-5' RNA ligase